MVVPPPGYGGNDLALIVKIAWQLKEVYKHSPDHFQTLSREGLSLEIAIKQAIKSSPKDQLSDERQAQLAHLIGTTRKLLQRLDEVLQRYGSLGTNDYSKVDRILFGKEDVKHLQEQIHSHIAALHSFRTDVIGTQVTEIKDILDGLVKDKAQAGAIAATSSDVVARDLTDGLASRGISQDFLSNNGSLIIDLIVDFVGSQGYKIDSDTEIDPLSPVIEDKIVPEDIAKPKGDDATIISSWLNNPDPPPSYANRIFTKDRSPSSVSDGWWVPTLVRTKSSRGAPSEPEKGKLSFLTKISSFSSSLGSSSEAHDGYDGSRTEEGLKGSSMGSLPLSWTSTSEHSLQRQTSAPSQRSIQSRGSSNAEDGSVHLDGFRNSFPRSTPSRYESITARSVDQEPNCRASESQPTHLSTRTTPSDSRRKNSSPTGARSTSSRTSSGTSSPPKSSFAKVFSSLGNSHQAEAD
ncbi:MAG: hypothetical protein M1812_005361 [Candelaria pacifica]|nr:MAG: hypothetical protein M1812_005361 [Candelaria pacifica]